jgi:hypothetical protein
MRYTLLELTQLILSSMDSDEVNSITDTVESVQVTTILKNVFYDMATELDLPEHETLFELTASGDNTKPAIMTIPTDVTKLTSIKYDNAATADTYVDWKDVTFITYREMMSRSMSLREETSNVGSQIVAGNGESHEFLFRTNAHPTVYTTFDDYTLIFNSYDITEDTTLQASKTVCTGAVYPVFNITDTFAPDLDPTQFAYFIQKAKTRAHFEMRQVDHSEAALETRRQKIGIQSKKRRTENKTALQRVQRYGRTRP